MKCDFCGHEVAPGTVECPYCHYQFKIDAQVLSPEERDTFEGVTIDESAGTEENKSAREGAVYDSGADAYNERQQQVPPNIKVHTFGCGSGILSIAALLLGADRAVACDIDEKCMDVAYENAALNGVGRDRYTVRWGDVVTDRALRRELGGPYDVVVANIVADVIKALASTVRPLVREGGIFLCSGIIDDRAEEVAQCLRDNGWTIAETRSSEGWFSYLCR